MHAVLLEGGGRAAGRWLPPQELVPLIRDGVEPEDEERSVDGSDAEDDGELNAELQLSGSAVTAEDIRRHDEAGRIHRRKESARGPSEWTAGVALAVALR